MGIVYDKLMHCYESVRSKIDFVPKVAIILGSGLGDYADKIDVVAELPYNEIDDFPVSTVPGHAGKFVFGYVENIDELFRVTSCMITKPGGITLSEAAALQVPVILYKPVPGQENENAMYFERKGAAVVIRDDSEVFAKTEALLQDDMRLLQMKEAMKSIYRPEPADHIVDTILAENHVEPNHIPIKSPALAQSFT